MARGPGLDPVFPRRVGRHVLDPAARGRSVRSRDPADPEAGTPTQVPEVGAGVLRASSAARVRVDRIDVLTARVRVSGGHALGMATRHPEDLVRVRGDPGMIVGPGCSTPQRLDPLANRLIVLRGSPRRPLDPRSSQRPR